MIDKGIIKGITSFKEILKYSQKTQTESEMFFSEKEKDILRLLKLLKAIQ